MKIFIENSTNEGDVVLDPFMGCGSTILAAIETNRFGIGAELDEKYFKITEERIDKLVNR